jgi:hypothetical protein
MGVTIPVHDEEPRACISCFTLVVAYRQITSHQNAQLFRHRVESITIARLVLTNSLDYKNRHISPYSHNQM